jgi:photosystem II stability/assembly factor-like uncharacterized protein
MKKLVLPVLVVSLLIGAKFLFSVNSNGVGEFLMDKLGKKDRDEKYAAKEAAEFRFGRMVDENGEVKPEYYGQAIAQADLLKRRNISRTSSLNLKWEELGPDNIGGRTRAIVVDNRDPSRNTVYAGAVAGGLWKSTDRANSWSYLPLSDVITISCISQDKAGNIYIGTGEGLAQPSGTRFNSGNTGNGIYKLISDDNIVHLQSTKQSSPYNNNDNWSFVNRIAIDPNNDSHIYAATSAGIMETTDGGTSWNSIATKVKNQNGSAPNPNTLTNAADVDFSVDGQYVYASVGGNSFMKGTGLIKSANAGLTWEIVPTSNNQTAPAGSSRFLPSFTISKGRIEIAVSNSNPAVAYLSICNSQGGSFHGYKTSDYGDSWTKIGEGGSTFNPFGEGTGQGWYDNVIAVNPANDDQVYMGGTQLYSYSSGTGWKLTTVYFSDASNPFWIHPDMHCVTFNDLDKNEMYVGCDGGIFKTNRAFDDFPNPPFYAKNRGFAVTQAYSMGAGPAGEVVCGNQDNGTTYVNFRQSSTRAAKSILGGDGVFAEISTIDPNVFIYSSQFGAMVRSNNKGVAGSYFYDVAIDPNGGNNPTRCGGSTAESNIGFVTNFYLEETFGARNSIDSVTFTANRAYSAGENIKVTSRLKYVFTETLNQDLAAGEQIRIADRIKSRFYLPTSCGLWMTPDVLDFGGTTRWFRLRTGVNPRAVTQTTNGDTVYYSSGSNVFRTIGLNSTPFDSALVRRGGTQPVLWDKMQLSQTTQYTLNTGGRVVEGLYVDRNNPNHVLAAIAGYSAASGPHVLRTLNGGATWTDVTGDLPNVPVYDCVIDANNPNNYIVGTEIGVFASSDGGVTWFEQNETIQRVPTYSVRQLRYLEEGCYMLYLGTHGRGMWRSSTLMQGACNVNPVGIKESEKTASINQLGLFPVPMKDKGTIELDIDKKANVVFRVIDMPGRIVKEITLKDVQAGKNQFDLDVANLTNGTYVLTATLDGKRSFSRVFTISK